MAHPSESGAFGSSPAQPSPVARLLLQMKQQPGKTAATGLLTCVLVVMLLRGVLQPGGASAGMTHTLSNLATATPDPVAIPSENLLQVPIPTLPTVHLPPAAGLPLPRDIFALDIRRFPKTGSKPAASGSTVETPEAESPKTPEARLEEFKRQVSAFRLEGTVNGPPSAAFLDGRTVAEGELYRGFRLAKVTSQGIQLEREGVRLELRMPD